MYRLRILDPAERDLARLDRAVAERIAKRMKWLAENLADIKPEPLRDVLWGLFKLRVGDFRVVYEVLHQEQTIVIHAIGHRREIYR